jgi:hypothetical protein
MNLKKLSPDAKKKYLEYIDCVYELFETLPEEVKDVTNKVRVASSVSKSYGKDFFDNFIMKSKNKHELCFDICQQVKEGEKFERAVAKVLCRY